MYICAQSKIAKYFIRNVHYNYVILQFKGIFDLINNHIVVETIQADKGRSPIFKGFIVPSEKNKKYLINISAESMK